MCAPNHHRIPVPSLQSKANPSGGRPLILYLPVNYLYLSLSSLLSQVLAIIILRSSCLFACGLGRVLERFSDHQLGPHLMAERGFFLDVSTIFPPSAFFILLSLAFQRPPILPQSPCSSWASQRALCWPTSLSISFLFYLFHCCLLKTPLILSQGLLLRQSQSLKGLGTEVQAPVGTDSSPKCRVGPGVWSPYLHFISVKPLLLSYHNPLHAAFIAEEREMHRWHQSSVQVVLKACGQQLFLGGRLYPIHLSTPSSNLHIFIKQFYVLGSMPGSEDVEASLPLKCSLGAHSTLCYLNSSYPAA